ncbi:MAG TPA: enoyl-CoA hydratase-related protein [Geminicoccaceae bacterium]|nr:enoyl-CoA hydratase-related protein [Geminicoccaceae bacterium]
MTDEAVLTEASGGVLLITLNRPERFNAISFQMFDELHDLLPKVRTDADVRAVVLTGAGRSFSAGGDAAWMRRSATLTEVENIKGAREMSGLLETLDQLPKPTLALVNGPAFGGGFGLVCCCDVAVAADTATFSLSEVKLGLIPATIAPYVLAAIGPRQMRRYALTGERLSAAEAARIGAVHEVVPAMYLEAAAEKMLGRLLEGGPRAQAEAKRFIRELRERPPGPEVADLTAERIARLRASPEGQEGLSAFLEKRQPAWRN